MKNIRLLALILALLVLLCGCKEDKIVHCDGCGCEITVEHDSNMDDSWIIYCHDCEIKFFGEDGIVQPG